MIFDGTSNKFPILDAVRVESKPLDDDPLGDRHNSDGSQMDDDDTAQPPQEDDTPKKEAMKQNEHVSTIPVPKWCVCFFLVLLFTVCGIVIVTVVTANMRPRYWVPPEVSNKQNMLA